MGKKLSKHLLSSSSSSSSSRSRLTEHSPPPPEPSAPPTPVLSPSSSSVSLPADYYSNFYKNEDWSSIISCHARPVAVGSNDDVTVKDYYWILEKHRRRAAEEKERKARERREALGYTLAWYEGRLFQAATSLKQQVHRILIQAANVPKDALPNDAAQGSVDDRPELNGQGAPSAMM